MPRTLPVTPGIPLYCTKAPGHVKYLKPMFIFVTVGSNTRGIHDNDSDGMIFDNNSGGVIFAVFKCRLSITIPMMTGTITLG